MQDVELVPQWRGEGEKGGRSGVGGGRGRGGGWRRRGGEGDFLHAFGGVLGDPHDDAFLLSSSGRGRFSFRVHEAVDPSRRDEDGKGSVLCVGGALEKGETGDGWDCGKRGGCESGGECVFICAPSIVRQAPTPAVLPLFWGPYSSLPGATPT